MKQFDVYTNTDNDTNQAYPYFVDIQTEMLESLSSRVVIPITTMLPDRGYQIIFALRLRLAENNIIC